MRIVNDSKHTTSLSPLSQTATCTGKQASKGTHLYSIVIANGNDLLSTVTGLCQPSVSAELRVDTGPEASAWPFVQHVKQVPKKLAMLTRFVFPESFARNS